MQEEISVTLGLTSCDTLTGEEQPLYGTALLMDQGAIHWLS